MLHGPSDLVSRSRRVGDLGGEPDGAHPRHEEEEDDEDDSPKGRKPLPWPARNKEGKRNKVAEAFYRGYLEDATISAWVERNVWRILAVSLLVLALFCANYKWQFDREMRRLGATRSPFCEARPNACLRNRYYKSILYDYRRTRDAQLDPGGAQTRIRRGSAKLASCRMPVRLHYADPRLREWWGHVLPTQEAGLYACPTPCTVVGTERAGEADVLVGMFRAPPRRRPGQKSAAVSTEAHSVDYEGMAATDLFVGFHKEADVRVNYAYALRHGTPCENVRECLLTAVGGSVRAAGGGVGGVGRRGSRAVLFMSGSCGRHEGWVRELVERLRGGGGMGVDSFGKCFHNADERSDPMYVEGRLGESKERISSQYAFHIVVENEILDDYVSEKFFEGLKAGSLMVYLGAPNARDYAPGRNSFIDAAAFAGPGELADYLATVYSNRTLYDSYFEWRGNGPSLAFQRLLDFDLTAEDKRSWQCRLCSAFVKRYCP